MKTYVHLWHFAELFLEREMFHTKIVEKMKTHILCCFLRSCRLWDNMEKHGRDGQATDKNMR